MNRTCTCDATSSSGAHASHCALTACLAPSGAMTAPATHRPSYTSSEHTACGLRLDVTTHLQIGNGETCERCTHVVDQVAAATRRATNALP